MWQLSKHYCTIPKALNSAKKTPLKIEVVKSLLSLVSFQFINMLEKH